MFPMFWPIWHNLGSKTSLRSKCWNWTQNRNQSFKIWRTLVLVGTLNQTFGPEQSFPSEDWSSRQLENEKADWEQALSIVKITGRSMRQIQILKKNWLFTPKKHGGVLFLLFLFQWWCDSRQILKSIVDPVHQLASSAKHFRGYLLCVEERWTPKLQLLTFDTNSPLVSAVKKV